MIQRLLEKRHVNTLPSIFVSFIFFSFHAYFILYINSTFIEQFVSAEKVGLLFSIGASLTILILFSAPFLIRNIGAYYLTIILLIVEFFSVSFLAFGKNTSLILVFFVIYLGVVASLIYVFDLYLESASTKESSTGRIRGLYLALSNTALIISPSVAGLILGEGSFSKVYMISSLFIIPILLIVIKNLKSEAKNIEAPQGILQAIPVFLRDKNLRNIIFARLLLQIFYVWMVIYVPVYLFQELNFDWKEIGFMLTIMLLPFALFQFPAGYLADKKLGEKELLIFGFIFIATSTLVFSFIGAPIFFLLAIILFMTRVGASVVEIMTESYFFKHVNGDDSNLISIFRATSPFSYLIGPLLGTLALSFMSFETMFGILGLVMFTGIIFSLRIKDTK